MKEGNNHVDDQVDGRVDDRLEVEAFGSPRDRLDAVISANIPWRNTVEPRHDAVAAAPDAGYQAEIMRAKCIRY